MSTYIGRETYIGATQLKYRSIVLNMIAGEDITSGDLLSVNNEGKVVKSVSGEAFWVAGFANTSASTDSVIQVTICGIYSMLSSLVTGAVYYTSVTAGVVTNTSSLISSTVGIALSSSEILIGSLGYTKDIPTSVYGYVSGGTTGAFVATTDRIVFATSITAVNTVSNLSSVRNEHSGLSDTVNYGYIAGGYTTGTTNENSVNRMTFSTGIYASYTASLLSLARRSTGALSDGSLYGYLGGGYSGAYVATTDKLTFSSGVFAGSTVANLNLSTTRAYSSGLSDNNTTGYGYFGGGYSAVTAVTDKIVFATSIISAQTISNLSTVRYAVGTVSDCFTYGYFAGGNSAAVSALTDRIVFSTGVTAANTVSNLSQARQSAVGNSDGDIYGYFSGGTTAAAVATTNRIVLATGVTAASTISNLSQARSLQSSLSDYTV